MRNLLPAVLLLLFACVRKSEGELPAAVAERPYIAQKLYWESDEIAWGKVRYSVLAYGRLFQGNAAYEKTLYLPCTGDYDTLVEVNLIYGHLFAPDQKHLLIRTHMYGGALLDVYCLSGDALKPVCSFDMPGLAYENDSIRDVNGDGYSDFLVHWQPVSGCCLRDIYEVFLYHPENGVFSESFELVNPVFYPKEYLVRGLEYGHLGEAGVYTYRWQGSRLDTVEYVYPSREHNGVFKRVRSAGYRTTATDTEMLHRFPDEYRDLPYANRTPD